MDEDRIRAMPQKRLLPKTRTYAFRVLRNNLEFISRFCPRADWDPAARAIQDAYYAEDEYRQRVARGEIDLSDPMLGVPMRRSPYDHQRRALILGRDQSSFAYFMEMGTGKSKTLLDDAAHNFRLQKIDALLILCPNSVKTNWVNPNGADEISKDLAPDIPYVKAAMYASATVDQASDIKRLADALGDFNTLKILAANIEGIAFPRARDFLTRFVAKTRCMIVVDESTRIKNREARRTKAALDLREDCVLARIMSGSPVIKRPLDIYSQLYFLDPTILGFNSFTAFRHRYAIMGGYGQHTVQEYRNLDELSDRIKGVSYRVTKAECLDLPAKQYLPDRRVTPGDAITSAYEKMRKTMIVWMDNQHKVVASTVLAQMVRLQQITANHLPLLDPDTLALISIQKITPDLSPKIAEAMDVIQECTGKVIIWSRFRFEIDEMMDALAIAGIGAVQFDGSVSEEARIANRTAFNEDPNVRVFVGNPHTGGIGITLTAAEHVFYLSQTASTEDRAQSEDRAHRIGQTKNVSYIDFVIPGTVDEKIQSILKENMQLSEQIMDDPKWWRSWI